MHLYLQYISHFNQSGNRKETVKVKLWRTGLAFYLNIGYMIGGSGEAILYRRQLRAIILHLMGPSKAVI